MNLKKLWDLLNNFYQEHKKYIIIAVIIFINFSGYLLTNKNTYTTYLFYPNNLKTKLIKEKSEILKSYNKTKRMRNTLEELLLGPLNPNITNLFSKNSKLLSLKVTGNTVLLNFNKDFIMDLDDNNASNLTYYLILQSIVNSITYQFKDIKTVKFYFSDKEYRFVGTYGPINQGIKPDINILSK